MFVALVPMEDYSDTVSEEMRGNGTKNGIPTLNELQKKLEVAETYVRMVVRGIDIANLGCIVNPTHMDALRAIQSASDYEKANFLAVGLGSPQSTRIVGGAGHYRHRTIPNQKASAQFVTYRHVGPNDRISVSALDTKLVEIWDIYEHGYNTIVNVNANNTDRPSTTSSGVMVPFYKILDEADIMLQGFRYTMMGIVNDITNYANSVGYNRHPERNWIR